MKYKNNPLNIRYNLTLWLGLSGVNHGFCEFDELQYGLRAGLRIMDTYRRKYGLDTVEKIIKRFAPSYENDTKAYISFVCKKCGFIKNERLVSNEQYCQLISVMCLFESSFPVSADYIESIMNFYSIRIVP